MRFIQYALLPFSWLYGIVLWTRNKLFTWGFLKSYNPQIKTICVGNLALGGTGKTPHIEYLLKYLKDYKVAVLSRGYGRETKETIVGNPNTSVREIGDEPLQIRLKFPSVLVVAEANRKKGIEFIQNNFPEIEIVLLDDALQHRKINCGLNILLTTFSKPYLEDFYIPAGSLRDHKIRANDADLIVVTKSPDKSAQTEKKYNQIQKSLPNCLFSKFKPGEIKPILPQSKPSSITDYSKIVLVSGIAKPAHFEKMVASRFPITHHFKYRDHYNFSEKDIQKFRNFIGSFANEKVALLATEKDATRLRTLLSNLDYQLPFYYLEIAVVFEEGEKRFQSLIDTYVRNN